jgi:hypothetical protein
LDVAVQPRAGQGRGRLLDLLRDREVAPAPEPDAAPNEKLRLLAKQVAEASVVDGRPHPKRLEVIGCEGLLGKIEPHDASEDVRPGKE